MSGWWALRLFWLFLGLLSGVIAFLPDTAATLTGVTTLIFISAALVLLGRWAVMTVSEKLKSALEKPDPDKTTLVSQELLPGATLEFEANRVGMTQPRTPASKTVLSRFQIAGFQFNTILSTEEEKLTPRKRALMWDSVLFAGGIVACAGLASLAN